MQGHSILVRYTHTPGWTLLLWTAQGGPASTATGDVFGVPISPPTFLFMGCILPLPHPVQQCPFFLGRGFQVLPFHTVKKWIIFPSPPSSWHCFSINSSAQLCLFVCINYSLNPSLFLKNQKSVLEKNRFELNFQQKSTSSGIMQHLKHQFENICLRLILTPWSRPTNHQDQIFIFIPVLCIFITIFFFFPKLEITVKKKQSIQLRSQIQQIINHWGFNTPLCKCFSHLKPFGTLTSEVNQTAK